MKLTLKDLIAIIPTIGIVFLAGVFVQDKFIGADRTRDAVESCSTDLKEISSELKLAEKYITYLEAESQFYKTQTAVNLKISNDKKNQLEKQLSTYPNKTKKKSLIDRFSQLKQIQSDNAMEMRIKQ